MFRTSVLAAAVVGFGFLVPGRVSAEPVHPHMHQALFEMREAHRELKEAKPDFGGHREKALEDLDAAIRQMDKALDFVSDGYKGWKPEKDEYKDYKSYPHLHHTLHVMREARRELKESKHDFGEHREKALKDLDRAINQVEKCIEFIDKK